MRSKRNLTLSDNVLTERDVIEKMAADAANNLYKSVIDALSPHHTPVDAPGPSHHSATEHSPSGNHPAPEKEAWRFEIRSGKVTKVSTHKSGPSTPTTIRAPHTIRLHYTTNCIHSPSHRSGLCGKDISSGKHQEIRRLRRYGRSSDGRIFGSWGVRTRPLIPSSHMFFGSTRKRPLEESSRAFRYGKINPVNQPSVREEKFDPLSREDETNLARLRNENTPLLQLYDARSLAAILAVPPNCFCQKPCARFDGNVPVYVCGSFKDL